MTDLEWQIYEAISAVPGQRAKDIAARLGIDRQVVNAALYGQLRSKVRQDNSYRWYASRSDTDGAHAAEGALSSDTPLGRLCRYYLDCLSHDDVGGVSEFATSKYGPPNYVELEALPFFSEGGSTPCDLGAGAGLLGRVRRDRTRQQLFLGYPVRLNHISSRRTNWEGYRVEPVFLFPFVGGDDLRTHPVLGDELPQLNLQALRSLTNAGDAGLMEEAIELAQELGLDGETDEPPDLDELLARLRAIRPEWDWKEAAEPRTLSTGTSLADLGSPGIYNRAILIAAERSPYTKGLETELGKLQSIPVATYRDTALGAWVTRQRFDSPVPDQQPLLEILPLNSEQRQAVRQSLSNPLTVITGPPGTGKSQVVTSLLINAAWRGQTVLFASKNNKAVDVVEGRVNALGPRPILLRLGAGEYQAQLAEYLVGLLASSADPGDQDRYRAAGTVHEELQRRSATLDAELERVVGLRNEVDGLEQRVEATRTAMGDVLFEQARTTDRGQLDRAVAALFTAIDGATKGKQGVLIRLVWPLLRAKRFARLSGAASAFLPVAAGLGLPLPGPAVAPGGIAQWVEYRSLVASRVAQIGEVQGYLRKLNELGTVRSVPDISRARKELAEEMADNSEEVWKMWLRLQPARMTSAQRRALGDYSAILQLLVAANSDGRQINRNVFRRYYELFPQVMPILSCWAVTSLSARGRIPFEPDFFDLLVVDEASQCDIASALPLLYRARRVVVIGDPMQLRHISTLSKQQDQQLLSKHELIDEYTGWSYSVRSLFDLASSLCNNEDIVALRDHHRSHADIIGFSNHEFYEDRLRVATKYSRLRPPTGGEPAVRWVNVRGRTIRPASGGAMNEAEAQRVVAEIDRLLADGYRGSIGVVSPFRAQVNRIREILSRQQRPSHVNAEAEILIDTVHRFQGDERDVMLFSPVVSTDAPPTAVGFLRGTPNLFNVAVTRARAALVVVGDQSAALSSGVEYLARFAAYVGNLDGQEMPEPKPEMDFGPEYPVVTRPDRVSDWERLFYRAMYRAGVRLIPQYSVEKYDLDFALVRGDRRLNIEIDGERYHRNWDGELCRRDEIRNQRLMELGWDVMRFWVYQVRDDLARCIDAVNQWAVRTT